MTAERNLWDLHFAYSPLMPERIPLLARVVGCPPGQTIAVTLSWGTEQEWRGGGVRDLIWDTDPCCVSARLPQQASSRLEAPLLRSHCPLGPLAAYLSLPRLPLGGLYPGHQDRTLCAGFTEDTERQRARW